MPPPLSRRIPLRWRQKVFAAVPAPVWEGARRVVDGETDAQRRFAARREEQVVRRRRQTLTAADRTLQVVPARAGRRVLLARVVTDPRFQSAVDANLDLVMSTLRAADVPFAVTAARASHPARVALVRSDLAAAVRALTAVSARRPVYVAAGRGGPVTGDRIRGLQTGSVVELTVFEVRATASGALLAASGAGCRITVWDEAGGSEQSDWTTRSTADRTDVLTAKDREPVALTVRGRELPTFAAFTGRHLLDVDFPIDAVYTWVDGSDPDWLRRKEQALTGRSGGELHALAANASRFTSRDELRYSLRSVEMFADWIRTIYLVTDDQVPAWLRRDHPRLRVVSHRELFGDTGRLPSFNSHAIESRLHLIDGLAEHYLYLNDDVFFGRAVPPERFFHGNGLSRFFLSRALIGSGAVHDDDAPVTSAAKNGRALLWQRFGGTVTNKFKHVPHPQRRSVMVDLAEDFAADVDRTAASPFRHPSDLSIASSLHHYYAYATDRAVPGDIDYFYSDIAAPQAPARLRRLLRDRDYDVFCLNDHDADVTGEAARDDLLGRTLATYFPLPSSFELPG